MITINDYTGSYNQAYLSGRSAADKGERVRIHRSCDGREEAEFRAALQRDGLGLMWTDDAGHYAVCTVVDWDRSDAAE